MEYTLPLQYPAHRLTYHADFPTSSTGSWSFVFWNQATPPSPDRYPSSFYVHLYFFKSIHSIRVYRSVGSRLFVSWKLFSLSNIWETDMNYRAVWIILFRKESIYLRLWCSRSSQATWTSRQIWSSTYIDLIVPDWLLWQGNLITVGILKCRRTTLVPLNCINP